MDLSKDLTSFLKSAINPLVVILGPTASGKTALSLKVAHKFNGEIISVDSRQIYKGMEIGTAAITKEEQEGIIHHMLGITTPDKTITLAEYREMALDKIKKIYKKGKIPMLVGGTGLYISSIIENYDVPKIPPDNKLRNILKKEADEFGPEYVHKKLQKLDPDAANRIHANNVRYVIRAIEIAMSKSKKKPGKKKTKKFDTFLVGISHPRKELYERINRRTDEQIKKGLIEEVKQLIKKGYDEDLPAMSSLGVKEIIPFIKGKSSLGKCLETLKQNTRRYAKRQMTWFRRYDNVTWLNKKELKKILK